MCQNELTIRDLEAEVADARETLLKALDADMDRDEPLRMLATRASNALYWRTERAEAAERARDEAVELLQRCRDALHFITLEVCGPVGRYADELDFDVAVFLAKKE